MLIKIIGPSYKQPPRLFGIKQLQCVTVEVMILPDLPSKMQPESWALGELSLNAATGSSKGFQDSMLESCQMCDAQIREN